MSEREKTREEIERLYAELSEILERDGISPEYSKKLKEFDELFLHYNQPREEVK